LNEQLQKAVSFALEAGYQIDKTAFDFLEMLSKTEDPIALMEKAIKKIEPLTQKPLFIDRPFLEELAKEEILKKPEETEPTLTPPIAEPKPTYESRKLPFQAYAKEVQADMTVIEDPTREICTKGCVEDYLEYFRDRFRRLQKLLRQRIDAKDATTISEALKSPNNSKIKIIAMITERRESKQRIFLKVEDYEASATVLVPQNLSQEVLEKTKMLLLDQVVCIVAIKGRNDLFIMEDILFPEVPQKTPHKAPEPVYAALTSDLHVGSKLFIREYFNRFLLWLNGKLGTPQQREIASHVKYVVIAGDIVDGIGIYPSQVKELAIRDAYEQYKAASKFLEQIPDYIELVIIPGNHDASRKALPQPALPKNYAEPIYEAREVQSLGNPCTISLHGVELLLYHGRSLDDIIANASNVSLKTPNKAMKILLQCRHLAPIYGQRTPIAPEKRDYMVIERVPDVFQTGHVHVQKTDLYRGIVMVNSGTWQGRTIYQAKMGLEPTPGLVPVVNLQTLQATSLDFSKGEVG